MATQGTNFVVGNVSRIWAQIARKMKIWTKSQKVGATGTTTTRMVTIMCKAGAPATDTAGDEPTGLGDLCWDSTNDDVYRCSGYVSSSSFTWTKIVD